jgi:hypothetical protein
VEAEAAVPLLQARLGQLAATLHLDRNLIGAAVAEGLLDLARIDRALQAQGLAGALRCVFVVAHTPKLFLQIQSVAAVS